jgi:segregation and condensation protein B
MMEDTEEITLEQDDSPVALVATDVDPVLLRKIIEGAILAANQPLTVARMLELFEQDSAPTKEAVQTALETIQEDCAERGYELKEVASGWRFQVRENLAAWVNRLWEEKPQKYSRALLETLALIAYRQPITRGDIEEIRGVAVSSHIMKTLMERDWVKVVGHRDVPGRPSLYATTRQFLDYFNLKRLEDLPSLSDIRDLDEMNSVLELNVDDEGLGEPDTDIAAGNEASALATNITEPTAEVIVTEPEEFVDGEEAFETVETVEPKTNLAQAVSDELEPDELETGELKTDELETDEHPTDDSDADDSDSEDPVATH